MPKEKTYLFQQVYPLPRPIVWTLLSDTDHLNRVTGLFPVRFSETLVKDGAMFKYAESKALGFIPLKWREYPFEWVKEERYSVERVYEAGPLTKMVWTVECRDVMKDGRLCTEVTGTAHFTTRNLFGQAAISLVALPAIKKIIMSYVNRYLEENKTKKLQERPQEKTVYPVQISRMERLLDELRAVYAHESIDFLKDHLTGTGDDEVIGMKPYQLAGKWNCSRRDVLHLFLHATKIGLLTQSWKVMCPNCRVPKQTVSSLTVLPEQVHCELCGIGYDVNFDRYVEMCFSVHPSVRQAAAQTYCIAGPGKSPHIFAQYRLKAGASQQVAYPAFLPNTRMRVLKTNETIPVTAGKCLPSLSYTAEGWSEPAAALVRSGGCLQLHNESGEERVVVLETSSWDSEALTAADAASTQLFRELFSKEVLSPGQQVGVESLTIFFSDVRGSTAMYEQAGDAKAYRHVQDHFDFLRRQISGHNGAIVKTIGDSVMATFYKPEDALKASLAIQSESAQFNKKQGIDLVVKLGFYTGPVIAVNANDLLDYFGHTVNMAARIQQQGEGGDIMISALEWEREGFEQTAAGYRFFASRLSKQLSGIQESAELVQLSSIAAAKHLAV